MSARVIIGAQWGDEGKGKFADIFSADARVIARYQGGANAGHTIKVGDREIILHLIPSGILREDAKCAIGNGVVLDPEVFLAEIDSLAAEGIDVSPRRLAISPKAHIIMPYHKNLDKAREARRGSRKIGTTGRGIGPCYEDKACRIGIRAGDLRRPELLKSKIEAALVEKNALLRDLYKFEPMDAEAVLEELLKLAPRILPYIQNTDAELRAALDKGENILLEGAQGVHLDIDHGTYPYVTSSNTVAGGATCGTSLPPSAIDEVVGIAKAYTTRVGGGPFPTELLDDTGRYLQAKGHEYGATTGRPRRCGWLDAVVLRESARLNGIDRFALTKLDVLANLPRLQICSAYELDGERLDYMPQDEGDLARVKPVYEFLPGFEDDISGCEKYEDLPEEAKNYIARIEELAGVPVDWISTGPKRDETIYRGVRQE
ncbi:MAG: adenylosuccinate synthase [Desulfovibrio sp.]|nr:adenylosuccinate synthase [Desulfovibrio sp.]